MREELEKHRVEGVERSLTESRAWLPPRSLGFPEPCSALPLSPHRDSPCTDSSTSAPAVPASFVARQEKRPACSGFTGSMCNVAPCEAICTPGSSSAGRPFCSHLVWVGRQGDHHEVSSFSPTPSPTPSFSSSHPHPYALNSGCRRT